MWRFLYPASPVFVFARSAGEQQFARELGADRAGDSEASPPEPCAAIIDTTPAWRPVLAALERLQGGQAGDQCNGQGGGGGGDREVMVALSYDKHLWMEKEFTSVANVARADVAGRQ